MESRSEALLTIRDLRICYNTPTGTIRAVNSLNMDIKKGEVVGIVGETGCGKSTLAHSIPRLLPQPPAEVAGGRGKEMRVWAWQMVRKGPPSCSCNPHVRVSGSERLTCGLLQFQ